MPSQCASVISLHVVTKVTKPQHQNGTVLTIHEHIVRVLDALCWPPRAPTPDPWALMRPSPERVLGRHASKSTVNGRRSAVGLACSTSPSVEPMSSSSAEMCGRTRKEVAGLRELPPLPTLMLELSKEHPKCAGRPACMALSAVNHALEGVPKIECIARISVAIPMPRDDCGKHVSHQEPNFPRAR